MAKRIVLAFAFILSAANAAPAIECLGLPDMTIQGTWQWQLIEGKFRFSIKRSIFIEVVDGAILLESAAPIDINNLPDH